MLVTSLLDVSPEAVRLALADAESLVDTKWLAGQGSRHPRAEILSHLLPKSTPAQVLAAIRQGYSPAVQMHPVAESIFAGRALLANHEATGALPITTELYRLYSLRDIARAAPNIIQANKRIPRLQKDDWKAAAYELLVAASMIGENRVSVLDESTSPTPDLEVKAAASLYVECKVKLQYEQSVEDFVSQARRVALGPITKVLSTYSPGYLVKVEVVSPESLPQIPEVVKQMVHAGIRTRETDAFRLEVVQYESGLAELPRPMSIHSPDIWKWMMNFDEWRDWHYILPGGKFRRTQRSSFIATAVQKPFLICFRCAPLLDSTQDVGRTIKEACRKQFKRHMPGVVRILVDSHLYGFGPRSDPDYVSADVRSIARRVLSEYSRLAAVRFDIITPPTFGGQRSFHTKVLVRRDENNWSADTLDLASSVFLL